MLSLLNRYSFGFALISFLILLAVNLARTPDFGWTDQLATFAPLALAAIASTPSIISGGFDISISPLMTTVSIVMVWLISDGPGAAVAVPVVLAIGAAIGTCSGLLITRLRISPIVTTLAMYFILIGVSLKAAPTPKPLPSSWIQHLSGSVGPVPGAIFLLAFPIVAWSILSLTPYLRTLYATGSNDAAAFSSGVNVDLVRVGAYALGGLFAGAAGIALTSLIQSADSSGASSYTLIAIAAVALGGTSLRGGHGGVVGSMLGAACIYLIASLISSLGGVSGNWLQIVYGGILLLAVALPGVAGRPRGAT